MARKKKTRRKRTTTSPKPLETKKAKKELSGEMVSGEISLNNSSDLLKNYSKPGTPESFSIQKDETIQEPHPGMPLVAPPESDVTAPCISKETDGEVSEYQDEITDRHLRLETDAVWFLQPRLRDSLKKSDSTRSDSKGNINTSLSGEIGNQSRSSDESRSNRALAVHFGGESQSVMVDDNYQQLASTIYVEADAVKETGKVEKTSEKEEKEHKAGGFSNLPFENEIAVHADRDNTPLAIPISKDNNTKPPGALVIPDLPVLHELGEKSREKPHPPDSPAHEEKPKPAVVSSSEPVQQPPAVEESPPPPETAPQPAEQIPPPPETAPQPSSLGIPVESLESSLSLKKIAGELDADEKKTAKEGFSVETIPPPPSPWAIPAKKDKTLSRLDDAGRKKAPIKTVDDTGRVRLIHPAPFPMAGDSPRDDENKASLIQTEPVTQATSDPVIQPSKTDVSPGKQVASETSADKKSQAEAERKEARKLEELLVTKAQEKEPAKAQITKPTESEVKATPRVSSLTAKSTPAEGTIPRHAAPKKMVPDEERRSLRQAMDDSFGMEMDILPAPPADTGIKGEVLGLKSPDMDESAAHKNAFSDLEKEFFEQDLEPEHISDDFTDLFGEVEEPASVWDWIKSKTTGKPANKKPVCTAKPTTVKPAKKSSVGGAKKGKSSKTKETKSSPKKKQTGKKKSGGRKK